MNVKYVTEKLKDRFKKIKEVTFVNKQNAFFLEVEVECKKLNEVTEISRKISVFLDTIEKNDKPYFLDVFSTKKDMSIDKENISKYLNKKVEVFLEKNIKDKSSFIGKIIEQNEKEIKILWNAKGQFRKQIIDLNNISKIELKIM